MASTECELDYTKKEYAIVGDDVFFSLDNSGGMPPWLEEYIKNLTYRSIYELYNGYEGGLWDALGLGNILAPGFNIFDLSANLLNALRNLEVAKNDYKFYVDKKITDDMAYVATLETLNASIGSNDATIKNLQLTYADSFSAVASQISLLTATTATSNAEIANIRTAAATQTGALAQRIDSLITSYTDQDSKLTATATAVQSLETFTGVIDGKVTSHSQYITTLNATVNDHNNRLNATSTAIQQLETTSTKQGNDILSQGTSITALDAAVTDENGIKLAGSGNTTGQVVKTAVNTATGQIQTYSLYSNTNQIDINGVRYLDGFGMYSGVHGDNGFVYDSEFWVAADKFKIYPRSALDNAVTESVTVYNPKTKQNEIKKLIKSIPNAVSIFSVDTVNRRVEINGDLVVNGTITTNKIGSGAVSATEQAEGQDTIYISVYLPEPGDVTVFYTANMTTAVQGATMYMNKDNSNWSGFFVMDSGNAVSVTRPFVYKNLSAGWHSWGFHDPTNAMILHLYALRLVR